MMRRNPDPGKYADKSAVQHYFSERAARVVPGRALEILEMAGTDEMEPVCRSVKERSILAGISRRVSECSYSHFDEKS